MHIDLTTMVVLSLGGVVVYIAYKKPDLGGAIGVGAVMITLLVLLMHGTAEPQPQPTSCPPASARTFASPQATPCPAGTLEPEDAAGGRPTVEP